MPQISMGIGNVGSPNLIIKQKHRWTFEVATPFGIVPRHYVQVVSFPQLEIQEMEVSFLNVTTWFPSKAKWQPMTVQFLNTNDWLMKPLYDWIVSIYNFQAGPYRYSQTEKGSFADGLGWDSIALLATYDGCGNVLESFELGSIWPTSINFGGEGNYAEAGPSMIEVSFRYTDVNHISPYGCSPFGVAGCFGCQ